MAIVITIFFSAFPILAKDSVIIDNHENRLPEANRYLSVMLPKDMMIDFVKKMSAQIPKEMWEAFNNLMITNMDYDKFTLIVMNSMVKHFTAEALDALADYFGSPVGKSTMAKFGNFMGDAMPHQTLMMEAAQKTQIQIKE